LIDKNSFWDKFRISKKELYVKKKKSQKIARHGVLKTSREDRGKEISEWNKGNQRQDLNPHPWIKRGFLSTPADKLTPYPPKMH